MQLHGLLPALLMLLTVCTAPAAPVQQVDHIVILRFCLTKLNQPFPIDYCTQLLDMFEATAWRSFMLQDATFRILALNSPEMPQNLLDRLEQLLQPFTYGMYTVRHFMEPGYFDKGMEDAMAALKDFSAKVPATTRITTRTDIDDYLHVDVLRYTQEFAQFPAPLGFSVVNQQRGWVMRFANSDAGEMSCYLAPFHFPFLADGQSFITHKAEDPTSILNFEHTSGSFVKGVLQQYNVSISEVPLHHVEASFLQLPIDRGYIYVRHQLSNSHNFMNMTDDSVSCSSVMPMLHADFGIRSSDVQALNGMSQAAVALRIARETKNDL